MTVITFGSFSTLINYEYFGLDIYTNTFLDVFSLILSHSGLFCWIILLQQLFNLLKFDPGSTRLLCLEKYNKYSVEDIQLREQQRILPFEKLQTDVYIWNFGSISHWDNPQEVSQSAIVSALVSFHASTTRTSTCKDSKPDFTEQHLKVIDLCDLEIRRWVQRTFCFKEMRTVGCWKHRIH